MTQERQPADAGTILVVGAGFTANNLYLPKLTGTLGISSDNLAIVEPVAERRGATQGKFGLDMARAYNDLDFALKI